MLRRFLVIALVAFSIIAVACSSVSDIEPADSYVSLSAALDAAGMKVEEQVENNFLFAGLFSVPVIEMTASGQDILAFEFSTVEEAAEQTALVSPDGYGIGLKYVNWSDNPQYFLNGKMIVVYDGSQSLVTNTLISAMSARFAGEKPGV
ncbi:MAG: hypothetical protein ACKVKV_08915 [Dehalococcoidia bacterium]